jgi:hypothetical protein
MKCRKSAVHATSLDEHYRLAFVLRDINDLSIEETANILGISRGAVKTRLRRARLMLRDILSPGLRQGGRVTIGFNSRRLFSLSCLHRKTQIRETNVAFLATQRKLPHRRN